VSPFAKLDDGSKRKETRMEDVKGKTTGKERRRRERKEKTIDQKKVDRSGNKTRSSLGIKKDQRVIRHGHNDRDSISSAATRSADVWS
jgi:hypothetical protein